MEIIHLNEENLESWQNRSRRNVIALGFFDGVHKGHQKVIGTAAEAAEKAGAALDVMSFFPHPKTVLSNGKKQVEYLMPLEEKARILEGMGVDRLYIVKFTKAFASLAPEDYVAEYLSKFDTIHAVAGYDFSYGFRGEGTIDRLYADSGFRITTSKVEKVEHTGEKISSTRIRTAILDGKVSELYQMLGRRYRTCAECSDGHLSLKDYYMLPQDGIYDVIIDNGVSRYRTQIYVDSAQQRITFTKHCLMDHINQQEIAITWERRVASHSFYQLVAQ
ncbi:MULTISPECIES: FAD synthetase family protein [Salinicoccus]|uniref:FAD synthase n=1 Tax=Salinicoccus roseus TaxID=45670 RepID=A0A0C2E5K7_9STAP|nr:MULTISPECIES: FAD synthetase family protein [Salinicoccus]KIH70647.1 riboflavin biosynthesis protein RibF [Salinicoccus roseus]MCC4722991.1 FAD synthetase family protein [Salinicoccus sp. RF5]MDB0580750.1 FAD synthetase family protein [Salinicoccus roseus]